MSWEEKDIMMIGKWLRKKDYKTIMELGGEGYHDTKKWLSRKSLMTIIMLEGNGYHTDW